MELTLIDSQKKIELAENVFGRDFNEALIHQVVVAYMAYGRAGTKAQKTRAEVSGGGIKPFKQKGTGRARAGTIRSPLWRKGGVVFAAKPRSYKQKVNKKMYKGALCSILSELMRQERLLAVDAFQVESAKTKSLVKKLQEMELAEHRLLIVVDTIEETLYLAARNLPHVEVCDTTAVAADLVSLVRAEKVLMTSAAVKKLEELLK